MKLVLRREWSRISLNVSPCYVMLCFILFQLLTNMYTVYEDIESVLMIFDSGIAALSLKTQVAI